ncbi:family 1 glycosylhydrolase [Scytonema sp. NUACC26]
MTYFYQFPKDFCWGDVTAAYPIEGAGEEGGCHGKQPLVID